MKWEMYSDNLIIFGYQRLQLCFLLVNILIVDFYSTISEISLFTSDK